MEAKHFVIILTSLQTIAWNIRHQLIHLPFCVFHVHAYRAIYYWVKCVRVFSLSCIYLKMVFHALASFYVYEPQCILAIYLLCTVIESTILMELTSSIMAMAMEQWWTTFGDVKPLFIEYFTQRHKSFSMHLPIAVVALFWHVTFCQLC